jgi:uncharacterized YigZ family protein
MSEFEQFYTIKGFSEFIFKEKNSEFIAQIFPVSNSTEVQDIINNVRKKHYNASHHCYALKFCNNDFKYSDDGEPNGTAGIRILNAIDHFQLKNVIVIVVRYFGGVKLGVGPLGKAYYYAAEELLSGVEKILKVPYSVVNVIADFNMVKHVHHAVNILNAKIAKTEYGDKVIFECFIKPEMFNKLENQLFEASKGEIEVKKSDKILFL